MASLFSRLFESPLLDDALSKQRIQALRWVLLFNLAICLVASSYVFANSDYSSRDRLILALWTAAILAAYFLVHRGMITLASFFFTLVDWIVLTYLAAYTHGSINSPLIVTSMLIAMAAGFIMGQVYAFFLITMVAVSLVGLYIADINDLLPTPIHPLTTARSLLFQMMNLALISVVIGYTTRLLHTYRQRHRQQQDELAENNRLLESHRATLERQVQERTAAILEQKQYFEALMQHSPLAIVALDQELRVVAINEAFEKLFGYEPADAIGHLLDSLVATTETMTEALDYTQRVLAGERIIGSGKRRRKDGSEVEVDLYGVPVIVDDQQVGILGLYQDVSARKQSEERLQYLATHDLLTELPNRFLYTDRLNQALAKAECNGYHFAVFFLDLDGFKDVNDTFGHMKGDIILREVAQRLMSCVRQSDTLARLGGDEFSYIIEDVQDLQTTGGISQKILAALARPFYVDGNPVTITASIGISIYPLDGNTADDLLKKADAAMYQAKDLGGNTFVFCSQLATDKL